MQRTNSSGDMSATSRHTGLPSIFAHRSQTALTTAPVARWMAPLSGPIQRSWLSEVTWRQKRAHVGGDVLHVEPDHEVPHRTNSRAADLVAAADGEGQPVAFEPGRVRRQDDVGGRIVRIGIHRIRPVEMLRGREAQVEHLHSGYAGHGKSPDRACSLRKTSGGGRSASARAV